MSSKQNADQRHANHGYGFVLHYCSVHNEYGDLEEDTLPFCTEADALHWVKAVNKNWEAGKVAYQVTLHYVRDVRALIPETTRRALAAVGT